MDHDQTSDVSPEILREAFETTLESTIETLPPVTLNVHIDVNDLLENRTVEDVFDILGKMKDLFNA